MHLFDYVIQAVRLLDEDDWYSACTRFNLRIERIELKSSNGILFISNYDRIIYLNIDIRENDNQSLYVIWHEIGHYVINYIVNQPIFMYKCDYRRSERLADYFACSVMLKNIYSEQIPIPSLLVDCGCNTRVAWDYFQYLQENPSFFSHIGVSAN